MTQPYPRIDLASQRGRHKFLGKSAALAVAGLIAAAGLGLTLQPSLPFAVAETATPQQAQTVQTPYGQAPLSFADLVESVKGAVVSINVRNGRTARGPGGPGREFQMPGIPNLPEDHPLHEFFKRFGEGAPNQPQAPMPSVAQGSGFFISGDGYIVTNNHVIDGAGDISVTLDSGERVDAEVVGVDSRTDLALIKLKESRDVPYVEFSDETPRVGDWVLAVGNPFGLGGTVTAGIISAHNRDIGSGPYDYLQVDAAVNRGNSGGPSFNLDGKVVGVNTAIFSPSGGNVGIAFAVPAPLVKQVVANLREHGTVERGWLGVVIQNVSDDIAASVGLDDAKGALISKVSEEGPAAKSELRAGDVIVRVNEEQIEDSRDLARKIAELRPNTPVTLGVVRDGDLREVQMELGTFPSGEQLAALDPGGTEPSPTEPEQMKDLGLSLAPALSVPGAGEEGVVITEVDPASDAAEKGLKAGDVILEVAGESTLQPQDVAKGVARAKERGRSAVLMRVKSGDQQRFVALSLGKG
jgi:serine protease Do